MMGVRGKIEAVIYAAEEPVTLAQLSVLFGEELLMERQSACGDEGEANAGSGPELPATDAESIAQAVLNEGDAPQAPPEEVTGLEGQPMLLGDPDGDRRAVRLRERAAREAVRGVLEELMRAYDSDGRGMEIREIAGGYRIATKPEYHDAVRAFVKSLKPPMKLSLQALETLAVIAYKQPVTAPEVSEIRGVDSGGVLGSLISRKLITTAGRKQVVGRPILYKTTKEFLLRFGLKDLAELPSMEEFEKMAGELQGMSEEPGEVAIEAEPANARPEAAGVEAIRGEKPVLAPSSISIAVEEGEPEGVSVNRSGIPVPDASTTRAEQLVNATGHLKEGE